jgi:hypothetical protein
MLFIAAELKEKDIEEFLKIIITAKESIET